MFFLFYFFFFINIYPAKLDLAVGDAFIYKGDCKSALASYKRYIKEKYNPLVASNMAISYFCMKDYTEAEKLLKEATEKMNSDGRYAGHMDIVFYNLGMVLSVNSKFRESLSYINRVNEKALDNHRRSYLLTTKCWDYFSLSDYEDSEPVCRKAAGLKNDSCYVTYRLGRFFLHKDLFDNAYSFLKSTFKKCPDDDVAYYYALTLYKMSDKEAAGDVLSTFRNKRRNQDLYDMIKRELPE
jgi:tetratricopeptide (TPR) repeat protein